MDDEGTLATIAILNQILEGVVRYVYYSFLVFGFGRITTVPWRAYPSLENRAAAR
jgi:hypothetical protein